MQDGQKEQLLGHPCGIYTLFFAEMWERFSYYGMRALLILYMLKGFLGYGDSDAYAMYGAYTALVYMTPFFGGMIADRLLGQRRAVVLGGLLMAAGHLFMAWENELIFFGALALLIVGNGFFKPNISTIVGTLYPKKSARRDGGFIIFYMGVNLGAAMAPLLCGYVGETYGWHLGFGLATIGMLSGVVVFVAPVRVTQIVIMSGAIAGAVGLLLFRPDNAWSIGLNLFVTIALLAAGIISWIALGRGGLPKECGAPPDPQKLKARGVLGMNAEWSVYIIAILLVPLLALFVSGFAPVNGGESFTFVSKSFIEGLENSDSAFARVAAKFVGEGSKPAGLALILSGVIALVYLLRQTFRLDKIRRERMFVVLILTFFSMLFWASFEQAGSSINNFTDRNVQRVASDRTIEASEVGNAIEIQPTQLQLGFTSGKAITFVHKDTKETVYFAKEVPPSDDEEKGDAGDEEDADKKATKEKEKPKMRDLVMVYEDREQVFALDILNKIRDYHSDDRQLADGELKKNPNFTIDWVVTEDNVGMEIAARSGEVPASTFQAVNAVFILIFGLLFTALWGFLASRGWEPSTPFKFALGLLQLGLGFYALWYGAQNADARGMSSALWLVVGYLLHTTGELCLSPVGLSMVTKLSPKILVSTVMGNWFLATALSQYLAAIISQFTSSSGKDGVTSKFPVPSETIHVYGDVFGQVALINVISAGIIFLLVPFLKRWIHEGVEPDEPEPS